MLKKKALLLSALVMLNLTFSFAQSKADEYVMLAKQSCHEKDIKEQFASYDFSRLIFPNHDFLGFIGSDFKRLKIFYNSVQKDSLQPFRYHAQGVSVTGNNKCDFSGLINIESIHEAKGMELGADHMYEHAGFKSQGILIANYSYKEDKTQKYVGIFSGKMILWWLVDKHGILHINDVNEYSDSYKNNQHIGTWTEYGTANQKVSNWGVRRIPNSGDLDIGAGEFSVNPKYKGLGWEYYSAY